MNLFEPAADMYLLVNVTCDNEWTNDYPSVAIIPLENGDWPESIKRRIAFAEKLTGEPEKPHCLEWIDYNVMWYAGYWDALNDVMNGEMCRVRELPNLLGEVRYDIDPDRFRVYVDAGIFWWYGYIKHTSDEVSTITMTLDLSDVPIIDTFSVDEEDGFEIFDEADYFVEED